MRSKPAARRMPSAHDDRRPQLGINRAASAEVVPVSLGLQGGGSLGAFAWGVLDQLLETPRLSFNMVSGASAGAMNAALLAQGLRTGGPAEARRLLEAFWRRVAVASGSPDTNAANWLFPFSGLLTPMMDVMRANAPVLSQTQINPLGRNPLSKILDGLFDPSSFGSQHGPTLVIAATRVRTGEPRLFRDSEVTAQVLLASACLPQMVASVDIDGEPYWDGGYSSNPPIRAMIEAGGPPDLLIVRTSPIDRPDAPPTDAAGLLERTNELSFGAPLRHELRSLAFAQRVLAGQQALRGVLARLRDTRVHMIGAEEAFRALKGGSKRDPTWSFLQEMRTLGHRSAEWWLSDNLASIGQRSTFQLERVA